MDSVRTFLSNPHAGTMSSLFGVGVSLTELEIWLRIATLAAGLIIAVLNFIYRK